MSMSKCTSRLVKRRSGSRSTAIGQSRITSTRANRSANGIKGVVSPLRLFAGDVCCPIAQPVCFDWFFHRYPREVASVLVCPFSPLDAVESDKNTVADDGGSSRTACASGAHSMFHQRSQCHLLSLLFFHTSLLSNREFTWPGM